MVEVLFIFSQVIFLIYLNLFVCAKPIKKNFAAPAHSRLKYHSLTPYLRYQDYKDGIASIAYPWRDCSTISILCASPPAVTDNCECRGRSPSPIPVIQISDPSVWVYPPSTEVGDLILLEENVMYLSLISCFLSLLFYMELKWCNQAMGSQQ